MSLTTVIYLLIYVAGIVGAFSKRPIYGLHAYTFSFYAYAPGRWWGQQLPDIRWAYIAALVTLFVIIIKKKNKIIFPYFESKLLLLFAFFVLLQFVVIDENPFHMTYLTLLIKFCVLTFIIQNAVENKKDLIDYIMVNLMGCAYWGYIGLTEHTGGRLEGIGTPGLESANQLGQHLGAILVVGSFLLLINIGKLKYIAAVGILLVLNAILLTESRGVLISLAVVGILSVYFIPSDSRKKFIPYLVLGAIATSVLVGPQMIEKISSLYRADDVEELDKSAASRFEIIDAQFEMFKNSPLVGYGHRGTLILSEEYIPAEFLTTVNGTSRRASHNLTMSLFVDHGMIGGFIYFIIIFSCIKKGMLVDRIDNDADNASLKLLLTGLVLSLIFFIVAGQTSNNKVLELDIWLYALIPLVYSWIKNEKNTRLEN